MTTDTTKEMDITDDCNISALREERQKRKIDMDKLNSPLAVRLRRLSDGKTKQELSEVIGCSRQTIGQYLLGKKIPDVPTLIKFADYYGVSTDYLLGKTDIKGNEIRSRHVCEFTGLSEMTVKWLHRLKTNADHSEATVSSLDIANLFIEHILIYSGTVNDINELINLHDEERSEIGMLDVAFHELFPEADKWLSSFSGKVVDIHDYKEYKLKTISEKCSNIVPTVWKAVADQLK